MRSGISKYLYRLLSGFQAVKPVVVAADSASVRTQRVLTVSGMLLCLVSPSTAEWPEPGSYPWPVAESSRPLDEAVDPPAGFHRVAVASGSFGEWLRRLPVKKGKPPIHIYDGRPSAFQGHHAVLDVDVGDRDLQQCADAAIRLRAEYLRAHGLEDEICFRFTSGHPMAWKDWKAGVRPIVDGSNNVRFEKLSEEDSSAASFRRYLETLFTYCGSASLERDTQAIDRGDIAPGDLFVRGGNPGHVLVVLDVVVDREGRRAFLLAQSYIPAQEIHIVPNPSVNRGSELSPWYVLEETGSRFIAPPYPGSFTPRNLRRFPRGCERASWRDPGN